MGGRGGESSRKSTKTKSGSKRASGSTKSRSTSRSSSSGEEGLLRKALRKTVEISGSAFQGGLTGASAKKGGH